MQVARVQQTDKQAFGALKIKIDPSNIAQYDRALGNELLLNIQQAGEILGAEGEKNSTKFCDVVLDNFSYFRRWEFPDPIYIHLKPDAYYDNMSCNNIRMEHPWSSTTINFITPTESVTLVNYNGDNRISVTLLENFFTYSQFSFGKILSIAKIAKIIDEISKLNKQGVNLFDRTRIIPIPETPKITKPMTFKELVEKYGVEA